MYGKQSIIGASDNNDILLITYGHPLRGHGYPRGASNTFCGHPSHNLLASLSVSYRHPVHVRNKRHGDMLHTFFGHIPGPFTRCSIAIMPVMFAAHVAWQMRAHTSRTGTLREHVTHACTFAVVQYYSSFL